MSPAPPPAPAGPADPVSAPERLAALVHRTPVEVVHLLASPVHRYDGRPRDGARPSPVTEEGAGRVEVRAGHGVVGDRYAGRTAHRDAALTVIAVEALEDVARELGAAPFDPLLTRRTVVLRGADVEALRGADFALDCGDGPVLLGGRRPAAPCAWMDVVLAPGAHAALRGRAGVRCAALGSGVLRLGPAVLLTALPQDPARAGHRPPRVHTVQDGGGGSRWVRPVLTRLEISGVENLLGVSLDLGPSTCIAGPDVSGRSNLFDAIEFL